MIEDRRHIRENRSQRPYDAQVVCDTAAGHFDECIWVGNDGLGILK